MRPIRIILVAIFVIILSDACEEKVNQFNGFNQTELEYLLTSDDGKAWERVSKEEDGEEIIPGDCDMDNYLIFLPGSTGDPKPLLYAYNPSICDSADFCAEYPDFCQSNADLCRIDSTFCAGLVDGVLYIGSWYAKQPFIDNDRSDTLIFTINEKRESIFVTNISSLFATFEYKNREGSSGGVITEYYTFNPPENE